MCDVCIVPGCNSSVYKPKAKHSRVQRVCRKHWIARKSGRVGPNWERDVHNFHRKGYCENVVCGITPMQAYKKNVEPFLDPEEISKLRIRDKVRLGMHTIQGDHIRGREVENANHRENIQTLCSGCHRGKSTAKGDLDPLKNLRKV